MSDTAVETPQQTERYNGWANQETWAVTLWLGNDEGLYAQARALNREYPPGDITDWQFESACQELVEGMVEDVTSEASLASDLVSKALSRVDWSEVAAMIREL